MKKFIALAITLALVGAIALSATMAYLTGQSDELVNTFTIGDINIDLTETGWEQGFTGKIIPGEVIPKDPTVSVTQGSEPCYVFVYLKNTLAVSTGANTWDYVAPNIDTDNWSQVAVKVDATTGVKEELYQYIGTEPTDKVVSAAAEAKTLPFFTTVTIPGASFTKASMEAFSENGLDITVQAFAHQADNVTLDDAMAAAKSNFEFAP